MLRNRWYGPDPSKLLRIYHTLVHSTYEYDSLTYITFVPSRLNILDPIHNFGIHISLRAFPTTSITNIQYLCGELPLHIHRACVILCYSKNVSLLPEHVNYSKFHQDKQSSINMYLCTCIYLRTRKINEITLRAFRSR